MPKNQFQIEIKSTIAAPYTVDIFNSFQCRTDVRNSLLDNQSGFISATVPSNTVDGILRAVNFGGTGLIGWYELGNIIGGDNAGLQAFYINTGAGNNTFFSYKSLIEFLKGNKIMVTKVRVESPVLPQLRKNWEIVKTLPDGTTETEIINLSNVIMPTQVNDNIIEFNLNRFIDGFTGIYIPLEPNLNYMNITFNYLPLYNNR